MTWSCWCPWPRYVSLIAYNELSLLLLCDLKHILYPLSNDVLFLVILWHLQISMNSRFGRLKCAWLKSFYTLASREKWDWLFRISEYHFFAYRPPGKDQIWPTITQNTNFQFSFILVHTLTKMWSSLVDFTWNDPFVNSLENLWTAM